MKPLPLLLLTSVLLFAHDAAAQVSRKLDPFIGLAVGGSSVPDAFKGCSPDARAAAEARAGIAFGRIGVEGRAGVMLAGFGDCALTLPEEIRAPGVSPGVEYPFTRGDAHSTAELRVRYGLPAGLLLAAGAGWLAPQDAPYVVTSAGFRTGGRVRLAVDLDYSRYRVRYDVVVRETNDLFETGPALSSTRHHDWRGGLGLRVGTEVSLR
jgi:hypothetical protein